MRLQVPRRFPWVFSKTKSHRSFKIEIKTKLTMIVET